MNFTDLLAMYGAILSTGIFGWNIYKSRAKVWVKLIYSVVDTDNRFESGISIYIQNPTNHTIHISSISILYPYRAVNLIEYFEHLLKFKNIPRQIGWVHSELSFYEIDNKCPFSLEPLQSKSIFISNDKLELIFVEANKREIKAVAHDQLWQNVYSRTFSVPERNNIQ